MLTPPPGRRRVLGRAVTALITAVVALTVVLASALTPAPAAASGVQCGEDTPAAARPAIKRGDQGTCVTLLQRRLSEAGYQLPATGVFDEPTQRATQRLQASYQGLSITGTVTKTTWEALEGGGERYSLNRGPTDGTHIFLTFDDCPTSLSSFKSTVRAAESLGIALVLFPYGDCMSWGKIDVGYARAHGHYVFSHSVTHAHLDRLSFDAILTELAPPAVSGGYGRPPYGGWNWTVKDAFAAKGMRLWAWSVDTLDWDGQSQAAIVDSVVKNAKAGDTVLMHMQYAAFNAAALTQIKDGLARRGLSACRNHGAVDATSAVTC